MKLYDKKRIKTIILASIVGLMFAAFVLYDQSGQIGQTEIIALSLTAVIIAIIFLVVIKIANK
jgi:chromate transport protein ChrA